jgi:hypothetical protein
MRERREPSYHTESSNQQRNRVREILQQGRRATADPKKPQGSQNRAAFIGDSRWRADSV